MSTDRRPGEWWAVAAGLVVAVCCALPLLVGGAALAIGALTGSALVAAVVAVAVAVVFQRRRTGRDRSRPGEV